MGKIYVVTTGEYSDYHIIGATLDRKQAYDFVKLKKDKESYEYRSLQVEEFENGEMMSTLLLKPVNWTCRFDVDGNLSMYKGITNSYDNERINKLRDGGYYFDVFASEDTDEDTVRKIAFDRLAEYKASKGGVL